MTLKVCFKENNYKNLRQDGCDRCKYLSQDFERKKKFCAELVKQSFLLHIHLVLHYISVIPQPKCDVVRGVPNMGLHAHVVNSYLSERLFRF